MLITILERHLDPLFLRTAKFILYNAMVQYRNQTYLQTEGIPMGTNCAVWLANVYLAKLLDTRARSALPIYIRYIDDAFGIYEASDLATAKTEILNLLNQESLNIIWNINIQPLCNTEPLAFLDVNINFNTDSQKLETSTYIKPLNLHLYLLPNSTHPLATLKGFIQGEQLGFLRLSSSQEAFIATKNWFYTAFKCRGYSQALISSTKQVFWEDKQHLAATTTTKTPLDIIPYKLRYSNRPLLPTLKASITEVNTNLQELQCKIVTCYTQSPSLQSLLVKSALTEEQINILNEALEKEQQNISTRKRTASTNPNSALDLNLFAKRQCPISTEPVRTSENNQEHGTPENIDE